MYGARRNAPIILKRYVNCFFVPPDQWEASVDVRSLRNMQGFFGCIRCALSGISLDDSLFGNCVSPIRLILHLVSQVFSPVGLCLHAARKILGPLCLIVGVFRPFFYFLPLEVANHDQNQRKEGHRARSISRSASRLIGRCFWLLFGLSFTVLAYRIEDRPNPERAHFALCLGFYLCAFLCCFHRVALVLR